MSRTKRTPKFADLKEMWLRQFLEDSKGSPTETARMLDVSRATVYRWMKKYGIDLRRYR